MATVKEFFGLKGTPFSKGLAASQIYQYPQLTQLFSILSETVEDSSMALITGRAGVGKTTAVRAFLDLLPSSRNKVIYLGQDQKGNGLLNRLSNALSLRRYQSSQRLLHITSRLETEAMQRKIILVVDEAHLLEQPALEDIRFLTNQDMDKRSPVTVFVLGQHWLRTVLKKQGHEALNQRMRLKFSLAGLTENETVEYIKHHMSLVGCADEVFEPNAISQIFNASDGIPREINNIAFECLLKATFHEFRTVDEIVAASVISDRELT